MKNGDVTGARSLFDVSRTRDVPMFVAMMKGEFSVIRVK